MYTGSSYVCGSKLISGIISGIIVTQKNDLYSYSLQSDRPFFH